MNLNTSNNNRYLDYSLSNRNFLQAISRHKKEQECIDFIELKNMIRRIVNKLKNLSAFEIDEWVEIQELKIKELYASFPEKDRPVSIAKQGKLEQYGNCLREALHTLIGVTKQLHLDYSSKMVAEVIQGFYYQEYRGDALKVMEDAGYKTNNFETLHYQEKSFFNLCCCWEPNP